MLRKHTREELSGILDTAANTFDHTVTAFMSESYRGLRKTMNRIDDEKIHLKQVKRIGTLGVAHLDNNTAIEKGLYYYQGNVLSAKLSIVSDAYANLVSNIQTTTSILCTMIRKKSLHI